jgi:peptide/nickel transport system substrate-binding protein
MRQAQGTAEGRPRRDVLRLAGVGLAAAYLTGCDLLSTDPKSADAPGGPPVRKGKEAPALAQAVEKGTLPPLDKRLPAHPMVVEPESEIGRYGGDLNLLGLGNGVDANTTIGCENLLRYKPGATELTADQVVPNVAERMDVGAGGAEYTFTLRKGMKWSDGKPFTADDILFWYEHVAMNKDLSPVFPDWLDVGGAKPLVVEKVSDEVVVFRFAVPNGLFIINMASQRGTGITGHPAHYLKQFHKSFASDIDQLVREESVGNWMDLYWRKSNRTENPDLPVIDAWKLTTAVADSRRPVAERNPYYWKTDPDGSQLPYIDRVTFDLVQESEAAVLKATNGEFDIVDRGIVQLRNKPVFAKSREEAGFEFFETIPQNMNQMILMLNMTHRNPVLRRIFGNKDFRIGLSHAIDRQEIIDSVYQRTGEPWQAAPRPESPYYNEELAKQYTNYDPDLANRHLDRVLPRKDADDIRLRPDGEPMFFQVDSPDHELDMADALEVVRNHWRQVGVDMRVKNEATDLFFKRMEGNQHDAAVWEGAGGLGSAMDPFYWVPHNFNTRYAMPWHFWVLNPDDKRAEKPPPKTLAQIELYRQMLTTGDQRAQTELMKQIMDNSIDLFYAMGIALRKREYGLVNAKLRNTPSTSITGWLHGYLMPSNPQQYFFADG